MFFAHTYPVTDTERQVLDARGIQVVDGIVERLSVVDDRLDAVRLTDGRSVPRAALFIRPDLRPREGALVESLDVEVDASGFPKVDSTGRTSAPGIWVAGNASNPRAQVITAAGEGSAAAIDINNDIVDQDVRDGLREHALP